MLETPPTSDLPPTASTATVKRYAPPNQRNRLGRRKSGGAGEREGEKHPLGATKSGSLPDRSEVGGISRANETLRVKLIALQGCSDGEAFQLLRNRWAAAVNSLNSLPEDSADRPVLYTKKTASAWGQSILPHQLIKSPSAGAQRDFISELRQAMHNANSGLNL